MLKTALAFLDLFVLLTRVTLARHLHEAPVYHGALMQDPVVLLQKSVEFHLGPPDFGGTSERDKSQITIPFAKVYIFVIFHKAIRDGSRDEILLIGSGMGNNIRIVDVLKKNLFLQGSIFV